MQNTINPNTIDLITHDATLDKYVLIISKEGSWVGTALEHTLLFEKINNYLHFIQDGQLERHYPQSKGKSLRLQIDCTTEPPNSISELIKQSQEALANKNIDIRINLLQ